MRLLYQPIIDWLTPRPPFLRTLSLEDFKIYVSALDLLVSRILLHEGCYEKITTSVFRRELKPGMTVLDVGANIGYFTLLAAKIVGAGTVYAFEPNQALASILRKSVLANSFQNVIIIAKAASNKTGFQKVSLAPSVRRVEMVSMVRLDDFFPDIEAKIDFIKMDIDGAEIFALDGMQRLIRRNPRLKMVVEYDPRALRRRGVSPEEYLRILNDLGLEIISVCDDERNLLRSTDNVLPPLRDGELVNLLLVRKATAAR